MPKDTVGQPSQPRWLFGIANWALLLFGLANLCIGTLAALNESATLAATSLTAGLVLLFAGTIDRFESFKGLGVEAKTRQLDEKLTQADEALRRLKEMTEITGAALIDLNSKMGRIGTAPGPRESIALADRVRRIMSSLGSDTSTVNAALRPWARVFCFDASRAVASSIDPLLRAQVEALERQRQAIPQPLDPANPEFLRLNEEIRQVLEYQQRLRSFGSADLDEFPDVLLELVDEYPGPETPEVRAAKDKARALAPGMRTLRSTRTLDDHELWVKTIEDGRAR